MVISIENLDRLFQSYNYQVANHSDHNVRIYTLRYGMYHAAELIILNDEFDSSKVKSEYSESGYATEVRKADSISNIEEYLFEGFFIKTPLGNELKNRYSHFVQKQLQNLPPSSTYKYIEGAYDFMLQNEEGVVVENHDSIVDGSIVTKINDLLHDTHGSLFIVIEAAAGFGKTCTANEVLNSLSSSNSKKLPFFTELSRNREARVFKHILLNEIDEQFPTGIKQNIVIEQIAKGRIPLIIDGFDELITKESNKEEVESMFTTILDLLKGQAKIIITSRKTAIFNSDEFHNSIIASKNHFSVARFQIKEPTVENWLDIDKLDYFRRKDFPIDELANPVLLAYVRNISFEKLKSYLEVDSQISLVDTYMKYLLTREQIRQNLKLTPENQMRVFRKLVRFMTEYNFTAETKNTLKDFIKEYNRKIIKESLQLYLVEERPSIEDLVETLSNHVFLDRKPNGYVGIINDFIFGFLVGENLILKKYQQYYPNFYDNLPQDFAVKAVQSFKIQTFERRKALWDIFDTFSNRFNYDVRFYFDLDYSFLKLFTREYCNLFLSDYEFRDINFNGKGIFRDSVFSNVTFKGCFFQIDNFINCTFQNCEFYDCNYEISLHNKTFNDFALFACNSNNNFIENLADEVEHVEDVQFEDELSEVIVLKNFFNIDGKTPRARKISYVREKLSDYSSKEINKILSSLKSQDLLYFKDDVGFISRQGIIYYNQLKTEVL
ncbi:NACHT domain-containing protein [Flavobacterium sp.]|uniref:NACHT domain-containing protein n=1 Tax=Flavobacterium sp. TaxID=239 RepID=UPI0040346709